MSFLENKYVNNLNNFLKEELPVIKYICIDSTKFKIIFLIIVFAL